MLRHAFRGGLLLAMIAAVTAQTGLGQATGDKIVYRKGEGALKTVTGDLKQTAPGVFQVVSGGKAVTDGRGALELSPADIVRVVPGNDLPGVSRDRLVDLDGIETGKDYGKAKAGYEALLKAPGLSPRAKEYIDTRYLLLRARLLNEADDKGREADLPPLVQDLTAYLAAYPKAWAAWPVGRALARLQADEGKYEAARKTSAQLAKSDGLPPALREEAGFHELDAGIRTGNFVEAAGRATDMARTPPASESAKDRLAVYLAAAKAGGGDPAQGVKEVEAVIAKTKDPAVRAAGYAMLGELHLAAKKPRDAMWDYLWVEAVFNQDRDEVLNAMARLVQVFDALGEKERSDSYKERMRKYRMAA